MAAWIGAALGAAGTIYGIHASKKAQEEYEENLDKALAIYDDLLAQSEKMHNLQLHGIEKGFQRAEASIAGSEQGALRAISAFGTQAQGAATQRLVSSGLYGSTVGAGLSRGIAADQARAAESVYGRLAGLRSGTIAQGTQAAAGSIAQKIASQTAIGSAKAQLQASIQPSFDPAIFGQIGQAGALLDNAISPPPTFWEDYFANAPSGSTGFPLGY